MIAKSSLHRDRLQLPRSRRVLGISEQKRHRPRRTLRLIKGHSPIVAHHPITTPRTSSNWYPYPSGNVG
jgi:hypothetical protein